MGAARDSGDHGRSPTRRDKEKLAMSYDPQQQHHAPGTAPVRSGGSPPVDQGPPGAARAANLLVGGTVVVLLIALAVVVMLA
jgi:hypothetical protein